MAPVKIIIIAAAIFKFQKRHFEHLYTQIRFDKWTFLAFRYGEFYIRSAWFRNLIGPIVFITHR